MATIQEWAAGHEHHSQKSLCKTLVGAQLRLPCCLYKFEKNTHKESEDAKAKSETGGCVLPLIS